MQKIKLLITLLIVNSLLLLGGVKIALAVSVVHMNSLSNYETTNNFKVSCTTNGTTAQFYYSKNGGVFTAFGPAINVPANPGGCIVQTDSSVVNDQTSYTFKVNVDGVDSANTATTFYDISGPSPVQNYYKEKISDGFFKLHWKNPGDSDFDKVVIYRGETADFSADNSHEIARVSGGSNSDMTYDEHQPDPAKTYYYALRALDHAGNSSSLVGDGGTTTTSQAVSGASASPAGKVTALPKEKGTGSILGTEADSSSPTASPTAQPLSAVSNPDNGGIFKWILGHKKISLGVLIVLGVIGYFIYRKK